MDRKLSRLDGPWASEREIDDAVSERRFVNSTVERFVHCSWIYYHVYQISDVDGAYEQLITRIGQIDPEAAGEGSAWGAAQARVNGSGDEAAGGSAANAGWAGPKVGGVGRHEYGPGWGGESGSDMIGGWGTF